MNKNTGYILQRLNLATEEIKNFAIDENGRYYFGADADAFIMTLSGCRVKLMYESKGDDIMDIGNYVYSIIEVDRKVVSA